MTRTISIDRQNHTVKSRVIALGGPIAQVIPHQRRAAQKRRERHAIEDIIFQINKPA